MQASWSQGHLCVQIVFKVRTQHQACTTTRACFKRLPCLPHFRSIQPGEVFATTHYQKSIFEHQLVFCKKGFIMIQNEGFLMLVDFQNEIHPNRIIHWALALPRQQLWIFTTALCLAWMRCQRRIRVVNSGEMVYLSFFQSHPGTSNNQFLMDVWWNNNVFKCNGLESSNWNNH